MATKLFATYRFVLTDNRSIESIDLKQLFILLLQLINKNLTNQNSMYPSFSDFYRDRIWSEKCRPPCSNINLRQGFPFTENLDNPDTGTISIVFDVFVEQRRTIVAYRQVVYLFEF